MNTDKLSLWFLTLNGCCMANHMSHLITIFGHVIMISYYNYDNTDFTDLAIAIPTPQLLLLLGGIKLNCLRNVQDFKPAED